jgi:monothiol glutaredoxin
MAHCTLSHSKPILPLRGKRKTLNKGTTMNDTLKTKIDGILSSGKVILFMKGSPSMPMCGFSARTVEALQKAGAAKIVGINILQDPEIRDGMKEFSQWPTFPQLYVDGKFVGGCDITMDLLESGELAQLVK